MSIRRYMRSRHSAPVAESGVEGWTAVVMGVLGHHNPLKRPAFIRPIAFGWRRRLGRSSLLSRRPRPRPQAALKAVLLKTPDLITAIWVRPMMAMYCSISRVLRSFGVGRDHDRIYGKCAVTRD